MSVEKQQLTKAVLCAQPDTTIQTSTHLRLKQTERYSLAGTKKFIISESNFACLL